MNARKRGTEEKLVESPQRKKPKWHGSSTATVPKVAKSLHAQPSTVKLKPPPKEDKEDAYITYLESKLGMNKGGKKKRKEAAEDEDGLDGALKCSCLPYFDLEKSYWLRSHGLGGFVCGANHTSKLYPWFVNTIY